MKGTTIELVVTNELGSDITIDTDVVSAHRFDDGSLQGPFVVKVRVRRFDRSVPMADNLRQLCPCCLRAVDDLAAHSCGDVST